MLRMKIFTALEEEEFETTPVFNAAERKRFLAGSLILGDIVTTLRTPTNKVCFLLMAGYFKARHKFFNRKFRNADITHVALQIDVNPTEVRMKAYSKENFVCHQGLILEYFGFAPLNKVAKTFAVQKIATLAGVLFPPRLI